MQGKERSFCTGCWRITLLFCVLALHWMPLSVHGKKLPFTVHCNQIMQTKNLPLFEKCASKLLQQHLRSQGT